MAQVLPIEEALARKRLKSHDAPTDLIRVTVDERRQSVSDGEGLWQPGVLQATPKEVDKLSKGGQTLSLLRCMKQSVFFFDTVALFASAAQTREKEWTQGGLQG